MSNETLEIIVERLKHVQADLTELKDLQKEQNGKVNKNILDIEKVNSKIKVLIATLSGSGVLCAGAVVSKLMGLF